MRNLCQTRVKAGKGSRVLSVGKRITLAKRGKASNFYQTRKKGQRLLGVGTRVKGREHELLLPRTGERITFATGGKLSNFCQALVNE